MFAVVKTGGKQYKVSSGDLLKVERIEGEAGQSIHLSSVLLFNNEGQITVGTPFLNQIQVRATIVEQARADKIIVFKKKRRQGYRRKAGHRQDITVLRIEEILTQGVQKADSKSKGMAKNTQAAESRQETDSTSLESKVPSKKSKVSKEISRVDERTTLNSETDITKMSDKETKKTMRSSKTIEPTSVKATMDSKPLKEDNQTSTVKKKTSTKSSPEPQESK